jgi:predicted deacylase
VSSRIIAQVLGDQPGPTLILIGGVHGNEPAGVVAARTVLAPLTPADVHGEVIALVGNLRGIAAGRRYLERDLNRMWTPELVADPGSGGEALEQRELAAEIARVRERARGEVFVVDLHTTSAEGFPFIVVGARREFARQFPLTGIAGLEEALPGVLSGYLGSLGCHTVAVEGGQNATTAAAANLEACVTVALDASGVVPGVAGLAAAREHLRQARGELPHTIEIALRHAIRPEDFFRMEPGFANIQRTPGGTLLARDFRGEIRAPFDGVLLLPLYQPQGDDGFFYGRAVE